MTRSYFISGYLLLQCLAVIGSEKHTPDLCQPTSLRCSQEVQKFENNTSSKQEFTNVIAAYYVGCWGKGAGEPTKPLPPYFYHSDCP